MKRFQGVALSVVFVASLCTVGACSSSGSSSKSTTTKEMTSSTAGSTGEYASFCSKATEVQGQANQILGGLGDAPSASQAKLDGIKASWNKYQGLLDDLQSEAPIDIKDQVDVIVETFKDWNQKMQAATTTTAKTVSADIQSDAKTMETASGQLATWTSKNC